MSFRNAFNKLRDEVDRVLDVIDPPRQQYPPPQQGYYYPGYPPVPPPPPVPPHPAGGPSSSATYYHPSYQQGPPTPPVPLGSRPLNENHNSADAPPPPYSKDDISRNPEAPKEVYWNPQFVPDVPVTSHFDYDLGAGGWGNNEVQTYTDLPTNSFHTHQRTLVIRANVTRGQPHSGNKYTSARLLSRQRLARHRGYVCAVLTAPSAAGIWPAFWMLPQEPFTWPEEGEVDIFEAWNAEAVNHSCLHWGHYNDEDADKHRVATTPMSNIASPHEYGFAWEQPEGSGDGGRCVWYVDGKAVMKAQKPPGTRRFEQWRVLLNVAMGGTMNKGVSPADGSYDMVIWSLVMAEAPPGGWEKFNEDWKFTA